ncbi:MAG TPA: NAD(P)H-hydrate dehydratase [Kiritimatiellia bacterium]|nr:NAD(P)H-hydrate dehydratase [Kiritimatiellia bacterium]HRU70096.1 NAD(P)H-hydrate dehydratase [Kiritimatiellia bacterium]
MRFLTVEQMRAADRAAVAEARIPEILLMTRAGTALARVAARVAARRGSRSAVLIAGHGNNGGDACVAARCLFEEGFRVQVLMTCVPATLKGAAREAWDEMRTAGVPYVVLASPQSWQEDLAVCSGTVLRDGVIVDGVLGTGCHGAPAGAAEQAILWINRMRPFAAVVAADLPSGMNGDTGETPGAAVHADATVTFARPKRCFLNDAQAWRVGHLTVADIGIPDELCDREAAEEPCRLIAQPTLARSFVTRAWDAHKGRFGHLCVVGGSEGLAHAPVLAAFGALRSGAGLVTLAIPAGGATAAAVWTPEAMVRPLPTEGGALSGPALAEWGGDFSRFDGVVAGPGLGTFAAARHIVAHLLDTVPKRLVLDADALTLLAVLQAEGAWQPRQGQERLLTPHPGEAARLLGSTTAEVQADRLSAVQRLAERYRATVALKGAGTLVCSPGGVPRLNRTGNPGMACGGMGDVLAGMAGALWVQGLEAEAAAATAVWAHGAAGDEVAWAEGQSALVATVLARRLGAVYRLLERQ